MSFDAADDIFGLEDDRLGPSQSASQSSGVERSSSLGECSTISNAPIFGPSGSIFHKSLPNDRYLIVVEDTLQTAKECNMKVLSTSIQNLMTRLRRVSLGPFNVQFLIQTSGMHFMNAWTNLKTNQL